MTKYLLVLAAMVFVVFGGFWIFAPVGQKPDFMVSEPELFCRVCEESLVKRLKSPSSYLRSECSNYVETKMTEKDYAKWYRVSSYAQLEKERKTLFELGDYNQFTAVIRYEAANSYGASIAGAALCEVSGFAGSSPTKNSSAFGPRIDGMTYIEWLADGLKQ